MYEGRLSFLNHFVHAAYKGAVDRVAAARVWKVEIEEATNKRNTQMERLADKASALWEQVKAEQEQAFAKVMSSYNQSAQAYEEAAHAEQAQVRARWELTHRPGSDGLLARIDLALRTMLLPDAVPLEAESRFDIDSGVLIHEQRFPDLSDLECVKFVKKKAQRAQALFEELFEEESQFDIKPVNQKEGAL